MRVAVGRPDLQGQFRPCGVSAQIHLGGQAVGLGAPGEGLRIEGERGGPEGPSGRGGIRVGSIHAERPFHCQGRHGQLVVRDGRKDLDGDGLHEDRLDSGALGPGVDPGGDVGREGGKPVDLGRERGAFGGRRVPVEIGGSGFDPGGDGRDVLVPPLVVVAVLVDLEGHHAGGVGDFDRQPLVEEGSAHIAWDNPPVEAHRGVVGDHRVVHQGVPGGSDGAEVRLEGPIVAPTVGTGGGEDLLV